MTAVATCPDERALRVQLAACYRASLTLAEAAGRRKLKLPAPTGVVKAVASLFDRYEWFPVTRDQIRMLMEGNVADGREAFRTLGVEPTRFTPAVSPSSQRSSWMRRRPSTPSLAACSSRIRASNRW